MGWEKGKIRYLVRTCFLDLGGELDIASFPSKPAGPEKTQTHYGYGALDMRKAVPGGEERGDPGGVSLPQKDWFFLIESGKR